MSPRSAAGFGLSSVPAVASAAAGAPWTAIVGVVVVTVFLVVLCRIVQAVFPQNSADRRKLLLDWLNLRDQRWHHKQLRRRHRPDPFHAQRISVEIVPPREGIAPLEQPTPSVPQDPAPRNGEAP